MENMASTPASKSQTKNAKVDSNANTRTQQVSCAPLVEDTEGPDTTQRSSRSSDDDLLHADSWDNISRSPSPAEDVVLRLTSTPANDVNKGASTSARNPALAMVDPCQSPVMHNVSVNNKGARSKRPASLAPLSSTSPAVCILEDLAPMDQISRNSELGGGGDNELRGSSSTLQSSRSRTSTNSQQSVQSHGSGSQYHQHEFLGPVGVPIVGYEIMEERDKFTVSFILIYMYIYIGLNILLYIS